jgi:hypothetical protein
MLALHVELHRDTMRATVWCLRRDDDADSTAASGAVSDAHATIDAYEREQVSQFVGVMSHLLWRSYAGSRFGALSL